MSTRGSFIIRKNNTDKELLIPADAHPEVAGRDAVRMIKSLDLNALYDLLVSWMRAFRQLRRLPRNRMTFRCGSALILCAADTLTFIVRWKANLREVKKETGSWSGLQAVTELQLQSLKQSVAALEYLQSFDWEKYLTQDVSKLYEGLERPRYEDRPQSEDFSAELKAAELEELVGTTKAIKVHNYEGSYYYGKYLYVLVTKMTPKQVYVIDVPYSFVENAKIGNEESKARLKRFLDSGNTKRVAQDRLHLADPVDIVDIEELSK